MTTTTRYVAYERIVDALREHGSLVRENGDGVQAQCPAHDDRKPSLRVTAIEGSVLLYCHAGCSADAVLDALNLSKRDLYDRPGGAEYVYSDGRRVRRTANKDFWQLGNTHGDSLFRSEKITAGEPRVFVTEGEKDVLALEAVGAVAVSPPMGANTAPAKFDWSPLAGHDVTIIADRDENGRKHAEQVANLVQGKASSVRIVEAATGKDAADHIAAGHGIDDFVPVEIEPPDPDTVHHGQARMAYRFAAREDGTLLHVTGIGWHVWDGMRWVADDRGAATRAVLDLLRAALTESMHDKDLRRDVGKCESASGVAGVLELAAALEPFASTVADLDADPYLLNVANGTLDLRTLVVHPHSAAERVTKVCRGNYTPGARSALWDDFLARVLPDPEVRGFVQRVVGVGLLGEVREHVLPILTGTGANGKSVFDKALRYALGDYASTAEPDLFMHRVGAHPTGEMDLLGVRWVAVSESDRDRRLAESTMKRLTGGDTIRARRMRRDFVEFAPSHTPLLITNHLPKVSGDDPAIWRRLRVVPFSVVIPEHEQDPTLDTRLQLEADGILSWAVAGYADYLDRGLDEPQIVLAATDTYHRNSDAIVRFIDEICLQSVQVRATTSELFDAWVTFQIEDGCEPMSRKAFGLALDSHGYPAGQPDHGKRWRRGIAVSPTLECDAE